MKTQIDTTKYGQTFGRNPRTKDYAWWHFAAERNGETFFAFTGFDSTAKKLAKAEAAKHNVPVLYVCV